jgi:anthranilate phosphoribosyltransferase
MSELTKKASGYEEAYEMQTRILEGTVSKEEMLDLFKSMNSLPALDEFQGIFDASRNAMFPVDIDGDTLDTCGTGGDGMNTFNISTAAALVCAAVGVPVAKHGNRSTGGSCGSADVLEALGVRISLAAGQVARCIEQSGIGFMFAPVYHPAFRHAAEARKEFGKRTYFNFLGPLLSPANSTYRVLGVAQPEIADVMGDILLASGVKKAWLLHGDGMDEISPCGPTRVKEFAVGNSVRMFTIDPREYGLALYEIEDIKGGDEEFNARVIKDVLGGQGSPAQKAAVVLNAAAGLTVYGKVTTYAEGIERAQEVLKNGSAAEILSKLIFISNEV